MNSAQKDALVIIAGPTAVGKTKLSISLAQKIGGEIISADSMQVYRGMDIGSAKVTKEEMNGIKHYLIDQFSPKEAFNVVIFQQEAKKAMEEIRMHGKIPILVGGTGFYIQALLYDIDFKEEADDNNEIRTRLTMEAKQNGPQFLYNQLKEVDLESALSIPVNNVKRIIRALEFYEIHHEKISDHNKIEREKSPAYQASFFVITDERAKLYDRINQRVDFMIQNGLVAEVTALKNAGMTQSDVSMQGLGYKEILSYLNNEISLSQAVETIKKETRHFAKRQETWFKREKNVCWIQRGDFESDEKIVEYMEENIKLSMWRK